MLKIPITESIKQDLMTETCYYCKKSLKDITDQIAILEYGCSYLIGYVCRECERRE